MKRLHYVCSASLSLAFLAACSGSSGLAPATTSRVPSPQGRPENVTPNGGSTLYTFQGGGDGGSPYAGLTVVNGILYGATWDSTVKNNFGTVFELTKSGTKTVLYTFKGGSDAANPQASVVAGRDGSFFGTTVYGGGSATCTGGCGTVYQLLFDGSGYQEHVLYAFQGGSDGAGAVGTLTAKNGVLYGTTVDGGGSANCTAPSGFTGCGTVFALTPSGSGYTESIVYKFQGGTDGAGPRGKLLVRDGVIYGTTLQGGSGTACTGGCGTVFRLTPSGSGYTESILHNFKGGTKDGDAPRSAVIMVDGGKLIGTTTRGGKGGGPGSGTVYELSPSGSGYTERVLYFFQGNSSQDGAVPNDETGLTVDGSGNLYGSTIAGGSTACACGTIFKLAPSRSGYTESVLYSFRGSDGNDPRAAPAIDGKTLYGTTFSGAKKVKGCTGGCGVVYQVSP